MSGFVALLAGLLGGVVYAGPLGRSEVAEEAVEDLAPEARSEEQQEIDEALARLDEANRQIAARVVVLRWPRTDTSHRDADLQRNVRSRIARPDALFVPEVDLYQAGRKELDPTVRPTDQRARVPDDAIDRVRAAVEDVQTIPWDALSVQGWGLKAHDLRSLAEEIWFIDRPELREPLFLLYSQIGRAADNAHLESPPYYESIGDEPVSYYWYLAGALAHQDPTLMSLLSTESLYAAVDNYKQGLDSGRFDRLPLAFDLTDIDFDVRQFAADYQLFINGTEVALSNPDGVYEVPLGRVDVYLTRRGGGYSLSDRIDQDRSKERFSFVLRNARKRMGIDFIDQLMAHPNECTPPVAGDILTYLAIYAKLHPRSEIYIAVPEGGSTVPGRIHLWRWDRGTGSLVKVQDDTGGFPVRFVAVASTGLAFATASYSPPTDDALLAQVQAGRPTAPEVDLGLDGVPLQWELRGHYNRLLVGVGLQYKVGAGGVVDVQGSGAPYADLFPTRNGEEALEVTNPDADVVRLRERQLQRLVFSQVGVVLGRDAAVGFGPRLTMRAGWVNAPHAVDWTGHLGYSTRLRLRRRDTPVRRGRVHAMVDLDLFGGALLPYHDSLFVDGTTRGRLLAVGAPLPTFGVTGGAGLTF